MYNFFVDYTLNLIDSGKTRYRSLGRLLLNSEDIDPDLIIPTTKRYEGYIQACYDETYSICVPYPVRDGLDLFICAHEVQHVTQFKSWGYKVTGQLPTWWMEYDANLFALKFLRKHEVRLTSFEENIILESVLVKSWDYPQKAEELPAPKDKIAAYTEIMNEVNRIHSFRTHR